MKAENRKNISGNSKSKEISKVAYEQKNKQTNKSWDRGDEDGEMERESTYQTGKECERQQEVEKISTWV